MKRFFYLEVACWVSITLAGCVTVPTERVHHSLLELGTTKKPLRVLVLPPEVVVEEVSAGGVSEEVKAWSERATTNVERSIKSMVDSHPDLVAVPMPNLTDEEQKVLEQHLALYTMVGVTARLVTANDDPAWKHKREHFDYTLGPGLVYLQKKANADTALMVVGLDRVSSSGRKGTAVVAALFGVSIPLGSSNLVVGMIELESGDLLWTNSEFSYADEDLRKPEDAEDMIEGLFEEFPDL